VGLERSPLSLLNTTEELLGIKNSGSGLETKNTAVEDPPCYATPLYPYKLVLTSPTSRGRSIGIVRSRTQATEFSLVQEEENEPNELKSEVGIDTADATGAWRLVD
jgi:hypothetical protein